MTIDDNNPSSGDFDDDDSFALENLEHYPGDLSAFIEVTPSKAEVPATAPADDDLSAFPMDSTATVTPDAEESSFHADVRALETESEAAFGADAPHDAATDDLSPEEEIDTDDFVRQLQADLERSKAKKAAQTSQADIQQAAEPVKKIEFTSVEDLPGAEEIDLSSIEAHHPSTYRQMEEAPEEEIPAFDSLPDEADTGYSGYAQMAASMPAAAPQPEPQAAAPPPATPPVHKEKKNRKGMYLLIAASVAILALGFGAYTFYPQLSQLLGSHPTADSTHAETPKKSEPMAHHPPQKNTYTSVAEHVEATRRADSLKELAAHTPKQEEPAETEPVQEHVKAEPPKTHPVVKEPKPEVKEPKPAVKEPKPTIARNNTPPSSSAEVKPQVFTVQVYSSPSKDDADERLSRLKSRNATNASISEQMIRGQKWYRVRFGAFTSRDEAEAAAKQLGFTQCWIDRVR